MTDEIDGNKISVRVALEEKPEYSYTFEDNENGMNREQAIESAKHEASIALTEGSAFYEWEVLEVATGEDELTTTDDGKNQHGHFSAPLSPEYERGMAAADSIIHIGDVVETQDERRVVVGIQGDTLIYYTPERQEFGFMIEEVLEYELDKNGDFTHIDGGGDEYLPNW